MRNRKQFYAAAAALAATVLLIALLLILPALRREDKTGGTLAARDAGAESARRVDYDINGNGTVTIADVTALLDGLSTGTAGARRDLTRDGRCDITDVTALLDYLAAPDFYDRIWSSREGTVYYSPTSVAVKGDRIYVSDATAEEVCLYIGTSLVKRVPLGAQANRVFADADGVYVLCGGAEGKIVAFDDGLTERFSLTVGHTPCDLAVLSGKAYICCRFSGTVAVVDLEKREVASIVNAGREPVAVAAAGGSIYAANKLQDGGALESRVSASVIKIDAATLETKRIPLQDGVSNIGGMALSADGKTLYITHTVARYTYPTTQLDRGWVNTNGFTALDLSNDEPCAFLLDDPEKGAANPRGVAASPDGKYLYFTLAGTGEIVRLDLTAFGTKIAAVKAGRNKTLKTLSGAIDRLDFLSDVKTRRPVGASGLRALTYAEGRLYACAYFDGEVKVIDPGTLSVVSTVSCGEQPEEDRERTGERLWNDASICYQSWESCSSCHPDGRSDGFNWDEGGDGWGTPKTTKSMIFSMRTPPVLATGGVQSAEDNVMGTVREAFRSTLDDEKTACMNAYLRSLLPEQSPLLEGGRYSPEALRGKALFESKGCASCHPAPLYTDMKSRVSPYTGEDGSLEDRPVVTPTLVELWRSAPYSFCGKETDVRRVIARFAREALTEEELDDLAAFVMSVGTVGEYYGAVGFEADLDGAPVYGKLIPGMRVSGVTVVKQVPASSGVSDATFVIELSAPGGRLIYRRQARPGFIAYGKSVFLRLNLHVPDDLEKGSALTVRILSEKGGELASEYRLEY